MSRLRGWARVENWRWNLLIPQFCEPAFLWAMQAAAIVDAVTVPAMDLERWTAPPLPLIEPDREGLAYQRLIRSHLMSHPEALRERGYRPRRVYDEIEKNNREFDRRKFVSDADARNTTQSGQLQGPASAGARAAAASNGRKPAAPPAPDEAAAAPIGNGARP
jgi:capsid protein